MVSSPLTGGHGEVCEGPHPPVLHGERCWGGFGPQARWLRALREVTEAVGGVPHLGSQVQL